MILSVTQYAAMVGKTTAAIRWQIKEKKLPQGWKATKVGNSYILQKTAQ